MVKVLNQQSDMTVFRVLYSDKHYDSTRRSSEACPALHLRSDGDIDRMGVPSWNLKNSIKFGASCYSKDKSIFKIE